LIEVDYDFHRQKIEDKINMQAIEEALQRVSGKKMMLVCQVGKPKESKKSLKDIALEVFE
jgi:tetraacyldisaccharide-1-P 4'-kinase